MDLALNNLQRLICHETQIANQPIFYLKIFFLFLIFLQADDFFFIPSRVGKLFSENFKIRSYV